TERRRVAWRLVVVASIHGRPGPHHEAVAPTIVVEPCRPGARGIGQQVVSPATNHANQRSRSVDAAHDEPVVPAVQVQADLLGLPAGECPLVERCPPCARRQTHGHSTPRKAFDLPDVAVVGTVDLHDAGQERVVAVADLRQVVAPSPQCPVEGSAALLVVLGWQPPHRGSDHRIGESRLEAPRDRVPNRLFEVDEQASIQDLAREREAPDAGVVVAEADDLRPVKPGEPYEKAVEASERLIAVAGDGSPPAAARRSDARPAPPGLRAVPRADTPDRSRWARVASADARWWRPIPRDRD